MKKVLIMGVIALVGILGTSQNASAKTVTTTTTKAGGFAAGPFGCWGDGYCTSTTTTTTTSIRSTVTNNDNGTVTFNWDLRDFSPDNIKYYSSRDMFVSLEDAQMNPDECSKLGLKIGTMLLKGQYNIKKGTNMLIVTVKIK